MPELKAVLTSLDGVDETVKGFYTRADDGRYVLNVSGVDEMPAVVGLKRAKNELLDEKKQLQAKLEAFGDLTPEKVEELRKAAEGKGASADKKVQELEAKLAEVSKAAQLEIQKAKDEAEKARQAYHNSFIEGEIVKALAEVKGSPKLLTDVMKRAVQVKEQDGKLAVVVLGKDGQPRIKDSQGNPFGLVDLAMELREDPEYGRAFEPSGKTGSGAPADGGSRRDGNVVTFDRNDPLAWGQYVDQVVKGEATPS
ncbi:MAG TPA: hypothetical protein VF188_00430 [Longimicrobiales bacterium]